MLATPQLSPVTGAPSDTPVATLDPAGRFTMTSGGQMIVGGSASLTVTVQLQMFVLPLPSVTLKLLVGVPLGKVEPLENPASCVSGAPPPQLVLTDTAKVTLLREHWPGSVGNTKLPGQLIVGN